MNSFYNTFEFYPLIVLFLTFTQHPGAVTLKCPRTDVSPISELTKTVLTNAKTGSRPL